MNEQRCSVCLAYVSMKPDQEHRRLPNDDGGFDHLACRIEGQPADIQALIRVFGGMGTQAKSREANATLQMAEQVGHVVRREKVKGKGTRLYCSCGWSITRILKGSEVSRAALEHRKSVAIYG